MVVRIQAGRHHLVEFPRSLKDGLQLFAVT